MKATSVFQRLWNPYAKLSSGTYGKWRGDIRKAAEERPSAEIAQLGERKTEDLRSRVRSTVAAFFPRGCGV